MLDIHRRTGYLFLAVVLAQIILISAQVQTSSGTKVLQAVTFGIFSQVQIGSSRLFGGFRSVWDGYFALRGAHEENQRLKEQVAALELRLQQQHALARRGAQLEQMLEVREQTSLKTLAANVIALDSTGMFWTVTIDRGSHDGVKSDMAVIAPNGVVGRVVDQPPLEAAKVQLLIDRNAGAGAVIERTGAGGVVMGNDSDPPLTMDFVANLADVKVGDRVVTSGLDGIYPPGFVIGYVEKVTDGQGLYKHIEIRPVVDFRALQTVLVVLEPPQKPKPGEGPLELKPGQTPAVTTQNQPGGTAPAAGAPAGTAPTGTAPTGRASTGTAPATPPPAAPARPTPAAPTATDPSLLLPPSQRPSGNAPATNPPRPDQAAPAPQRPVPSTATPSTTTPSTTTPSATPPATPPPASPTPGAPVPGGAR